MAEKIYPKGINTFAKHEKAPDFVLGTIVINLSNFKEWINGDGKEYLSDYKGSPQLKLQVLQGKERLNILVDTYKVPTRSENLNNVAKKEATPEPDDDSQDLPF